MKKSSFVALILGTISVVLFALGICMVLVTQWNTFMPGIVFGCVGLVLGLITLIIWRRMEHKTPIQLNRKTMFTVIVGIIGALALGIGMCLTMVWNHLIPGIIIGLTGIVVLLSLIPIMKGIK